MTDRFDIHILPFHHYVKFKEADYTQFIIQFTIIQDGILYDNGYEGRYECCDQTIKDIIKTADDFLAGRIRHSLCLSFDNPEVCGDHRYEYYFDINVGTDQDDHWVFNVVRDFNDKNRLIKYTCKISCEQIAAMKSSLEQQVMSFDWENYGKTEYYRFDLPDRPYEWCYSAKDLEKTLNKLMIGDKLQRVLVSGENYALPLSVRDNWVDYYLGTRVYMELDNCEIDMEADATGLFKIRTFEKAEITKTKFYGELEDPDNVLCDTRYIFDLNYTGETVLGVVVDDVDYWEYTAIGFDKSKVGNPVELPSAIHIGFKNNTALTIVGVDDDFVLEMEEL